MACKRVLRLSSAAFPRRASRMGRVFGDQTGAGSSTSPRRGTRPFGHSGSPERTGPNAAKRGHSKCGSAPRVELVLRRKLAQRFVYIGKSWITAKQRTSRGLKDRVLIWLVVDTSITRSKGMTAPGNLTCWAKVGMIGQIANF